MLVIHTHWTQGALAVWAESSGVAPNDAARAANPEAPASDAPRHPFAADPHTCRAMLDAALPGALRRLDDADRAVHVLLPTIDNRPAPSPTLSHATGHAASLGAGLDAAALREWSVAATAVPPDLAPAVLDAIEDLADETSASSARWRSSATPEARHVALGPTVPFFAAAARHARSLLAEQRFVPMLYQGADGDLRGGWRPWLGDESAAMRTSALLRAMPTSARAACDSSEHEPWPILSGFLDAVIDAACRSALRSEQMIEAVEDRDAAQDPQVAWLTGLLDEGVDSPAAPELRSDMVRSVRRWISRLDDRGADAAWRLALRLEEPIASATLGDFQAPGDDLVWRLRIALRAVEDERVEVEAADIWSAGADAITANGLRLESPQELLLRELGRASRLYLPLEKALDGAQPEVVELNTKQAYQFLREVRPLLLEEGVAVEAPAWWDSPAARLGVRLQIESDPTVPEPGAAGDRSPASSFGLGALVDYHWRIAVGDTALSVEDLERLASENTPLVRVAGRWIEIRPRDVKAAAKFLRENAGGQITLGEAMHLAFDAEAEETGVEVLGLDATGWVADLFSDDSDERMPELQQPDGFEGVLRPYQKRGVSWLSFLEHHGLGACLADDMGLGKTIQLLALVQSDKELERTGKGPVIGPTLIIAPMSVVENWRREIIRFTPGLSALVHHGPERHTDDALVNAASAHDIVITTYALANRDRESLTRVPWGRIVLDEAQNIKNPTTKQTQAIRQLQSPRRIALTGTPVENRLTELWSIMQFCNPGWLGTPDRFRRRFAAPIEKRHDKQRRARLRALVQPYILRRLKSDPNINVDLPPKVETKEFASLTAEQATLYQAAVNEMLGEVDRAEGVRRRGMVLAMLVKLKQICNHPAQFLGEYDPSGDRTPQPSRSGKTTRLIQLLDESLAAGDQTLIFTQFRTMGAILQATLMHEFDREVLFLHGGTPRAVRQQMIDRFQQADGSAPIFILSLKAGGVGMNLTAASHVIHFDRWWNPAVENQATDRAHRIGQTRTVQVHKFVVAGTLEERIDQMIEEKTELAETIIGSGETWLTELSTGQLRELLSLRSGAVADSFDDDDEDADAGEPADEISRRGAPQTSLGGS
ncbi:MAG: DEAD/DEAH box helicase [Phycisphaeraceae bacterium]|nr:DEAD/DEAH box helicase [Phycisphaeraceae bacterium]MCB9848282.1 DEAD/DEAH box helicase [Phycisphaeraceae bacterium]